jgi:hypothetical protein
VWTRAGKRSLGCVLIAVPAAFAAGSGSCVVHTCLQCSVLQCVMMNAHGGAHTVKNTGGLRFPRRRPYLQAVCGEARGVLFDVAGCQV